MANLKKVPMIVFPKEKQKILLEEIKKFFLVQRDEEIGDLSAQLFLDFITDSIGPYVYNQAIHDAHQLMVGKVEDLYCLEKRER